MDILIKKLFAKLLFAAYRFLDAVFSMFKVLVGIEKVNANGDERSLIDVFLSSNVITKAFAYIFLISIVLAAVSVIVAIIRNIINLKGGERKSQFSIAGQGLYALLNSLVMALVMVIGITFADGLLVQVYKATAENDDVSLSVRLFDMCIDTTYVYDYNKPQISYEVEKDNDGNIISIREVITHDYLYETNEDGSFKYDSFGNKIRVVQDGYYESRNVNDLDFESQTVDDVFGKHKKDWLGLFETADGKYTVEPIVYLDSFNIFLAYLTVIIILVALVWSMLGLVKRIYDLVILFIALPLISATIPLDDGARFKAWRDAVVSKVVLAYGAVIAINVFIMMVTPISAISLGNGMSALTENIFKMFLLIGGALSISGGQLLVARLMGTSAEEGREMANSARTLLAGLGAAGGIARGAKNMLLGGQNKYGRQKQGLIPSLAKAGNFVGEKTGGQKYVGSKFGGAMRAIGRVASPQQRGIMPTGSGQNMNSSISAGGGSSNIFSGAPGTMPQTGSPSPKSEGQNGSLAKSTTSRQLKNKSDQPNKGDGKK
ncbi:MAG: hypothetical protein HFE26_00350 [Clostridia bacterium]|nr:hypothetical protein [Clostridia bacterium]